MKITKSNQFTVSKWAGGITTQLSIFPENASLVARDFDWRISSAVVEVEESDFTLFEGYERILIPLTGELEMIHQTPNGELFQKASKFELARFSGDWQTKGKGKLTDFNFIFKPYFTPKVELIFGKKDSELKLTISPDLLYLFEGSIELNGEYIEAPALVADLEHNELFVNCLSNSSLVSLQLNAIQ